MRNPASKSVRPAEFYSAVTQSEEQRGESPLRAPTAGLVFLMRNQTVPNGHQSPTTSTLLTCQQPCARQRPRYFDGR